MLVGLGSYPGERCRAGNEPGKWTEPRRMLPIGSSYPLVKGGPYSFHVPPLSFRQHSEGLDPLQHW